MAGESEERKIHIPRDIDMYITRAGYPLLHVVVIGRDYAELDDIKIRMSISKVRTTYPIFHLWEISKDVREKVKQRLWMERILHEDYSDRASTTVAR